MEVQKVLEFQERYYFQFRKLSFNKLKSQPKRLSLPDAPAPTARLLEQEYYFDENKIVELILNIFNK